MSFFGEVAVTNCRSPALLNSRLAREESPASVQTTNFDRPKSDTILSSSGTIMGCSLELPGARQKARGIPPASMNSPICTIGLGLCSLETP